MQPKRHLLPVLVTLALALAATAARADDQQAAPPPVLDLAGNWNCRLDRDDVGIRQSWFAAPMDAKVWLPGAITAQGLGDDVTVDTPWTGQIVDRSWFTDPKYAPYRRPGHIKLPFWLTPEKYFVGPVWYQRKVEIPAGWQNKRIALTLERPHWETTVWVDDQRMGSQNSLAVPHRYDLSAALPPGQHRLTLRIDNRLVIPVGSNSHSVTDHTQGNWNGVVGRVDLAATEKIWIDDVQVVPNVAQHQARIYVSIGNATGHAAPGRLTFDCILRDPAQPRAPVIHQSLDVNIQAQGAGFGTILSLDEQTGTWDEFQPRCWRVTIQLSLDGPPAMLLDEQSAELALREIRSEGNRLLLNGRPLFLRGTLECCVFPKTGYPPTDVAAWQRIFTVCKAHGLNLMRFHSWCPPEAAFDAADKLGFYLYVECPSWANGDSRLGDGLAIDQWLYDESDRILKEYGNHPSFILMSYGNEPGGKNHPKYLAQLVESWKKRDPRRLYTSGAGWPMIPENQWHLTPTPRIQGWGQGLKSRINAQPPETMTDYRDFVAKQTAPVVSHEIGQWCVYPNFDEIPKYTGPLKARNFEIFQDDLALHHMLDQAHHFLMASGKLQALCYKEEIESALRTPGFGGFCLLDLHDFPGQGTALVGVLDPFWDSKGYITPQEYHRFCCETVPLARMTKRAWTNDETFQARIEVAHFGPKDLEPAQEIHWSVKRGDGTLVNAGRFPPQRVPAGGLAPIGEVTLQLAELKTAAHLNLEVAIKDTSYANDWDFWVYPPAPSAAPTAESLLDPGITLAARLDEAAVAALGRKEKVLLLPPPETIRGDKLGRVPPGFSSIFWNTAWTRRQPPHTLGILCDPQHPALADFPTEYHSNWQWWELVTRAHPFLMDDLPTELRPAVQLIDDWFTNRRLGLVFEAQVGGGRLLACGIDLRRDLATRPVARQLLTSLSHYMTGTAFRPKMKLKAAQVQALLEP